MSAPVVEAPLTLAEPPQARQGLAETAGLWGNLGISLLLPVAAAFVVLPGRPLLVSVLAVVVGAAIGAVLLGLTAAPAASERVPAMVLLRGLLGRRASALPTGLNIVQCVGWATFEIVIIAEAASRALHAPRWPFVLAAGAVATLMAVRPLASVRVLARYAVWVALAVTAYLFVRVLSRPLPQVTEGGAGSFWAAVDVVIALPVSWFPLAGDYTRHARSARTALVGSAAGYGVSTVLFFTLGLLALSAYGASGLDVVGALLAVPLGLLAVLLLVAVELDEVFANIYSTAVSTQNLAARLDRRVLAVAVGAAATVLALTVDIGSYEAFLFLIGAVFVPLAGVLVVAYHAVPRGAWDTSDTAPARPALLLPWVAGFVAYQLTLPTSFDGTFAGWTTWWTARQADLHISATNGLSASLVSLSVATLLTAVVLLPRALRPVIGRLHVLTDARSGRDPLAVVAASVAAGAPVVQVRAKGVPDRELYDLTVRVLALCAPTGAVCLVDDRVDVALAAGAAGTHLGATDLPLAAARRVAGAGHVLGGTAREPVAAAALVADGADYLGVGPSYATSTKDGLPAALGPRGVGAVARAVDVPVIAIGGITAARVPELLSAGAYGVAVVSEVSDAADPERAVRALLAALP